MSVRTLWGQLLKGEVVSASSLQNDAERRLLKELANRHELSISRIPVKGKLVTHYQLKPEI